MLSFSIGLHVLAPPHSSLSCPSSNLERAVFVMPSLLPSDVVFILSPAFVEIYEAIIGNRSETVVFSRKPYRKPFGNCCVFSLTVEFEKEIKGYFISFSNSNS